MQQSLIQVLSAYPLSSRYVDELRKALGQDFEQLTLGELRERAGANLWGVLRGLNPQRLLLPIEDENGVALLPVTKLVATLTRARLIEVVGPDRKTVPISRLSIAGDFLRFACASLACLAEAARASWELRGLLRAERIASRVGPGKVFYLKTNLWFGVKAGGSIGHIAGVVNALHDGGYPVVFASAEAPVMVRSGVDTHNVAPPTTFGVPYELNNYRFQRRFEKDAIGFLRGDTFAFIYQRLSAANYLGAVLSRLTGLPLVVEYNGSEAWIAKNWGRGMRFHKLAVAAEDAMLRHAHRVVTVSHVLRDELTSRGVEPDSIVTYPNCIDPQVFDRNRFSTADCSELRARYNIAADARVVGFVGTFGQWHGTEVLASAIANLKQKHGPWLQQHKVHFLLIGDGLKMREVREIIARAGAEDICTLTGLVPQDSAPLHLAAADVLISPHVPNADGTPFFGSPTKLFEYMAMGKPIYASRLDQIGEVLSPALDVDRLPERPPESDDGAVAVLGEPGDVEALLRGITFLVERRDWADSLGARSLQLVLAKYTWEQHVREILKSLLVL